MFETLQSYAELIATQRSWSWALVAIVCLACSMTVRSWFLNPLAGRLNEVEPRLAKDFRRAYLRRSLPGWFFFLAANAALIYVWLRYAPGPLTRQAAAWLAGTAAVYLLSILLHVMAFGSAGIDVLKKQPVQEPEKPVRF